MPSCARGPIRIVLLSIIYHVANCAVPQDASQDVAVHDINADVRRVKAEKDMPDLQDQVDGVRRVVARAKSASESGLLTGESVKRQMSKEQLSDGDSTGSERTGHATVVEIKATGFVGSVEDVAGAVRRVGAAHTDRMSESTDDLVRREAIKGSAALSSQGGDLAVTQQARTQASARSDTTRIDSIMREFAATFRRSRSGFWKLLVLLIATLLAGVVAVGGAMYLSRSLLLPQRSTQQNSNSQSTRPQSRSRSRDKSNSGRAESDGDGQGSPTRGRGTSFTHAANATLAAKLSGKVRSGSKPKSPFGRATSLDAPRKQECLPPPSPQPGSPR